MSECQFPDRSIDLIPLDYWFWDPVDSVVSKKQPRALVELKIMVEEFAATGE